MKATVIVKVIGLVSFLGGHAMASPAIAGGNALSLTERTASKSHPCFFCPWLCTLPGRSLDIK